MGGLRTSSCGSAVHAAAPSSSPTRGSARRSPRRSDPIASVPSTPAPASPSRERSEIGGSVSSKSSRSTTRKPSCGSRPCLTWSRPRRARAGCSLTRRQRVTPRSPRRCAPTSPRASLRADRGSAGVRFYEVGGGKGALELLSLRFCEPPRPRREAAAADAENDQKLEAEKEEAEVRLTGGRDEQGHGAERKRDAVE